MDDRTKKTLVGAAGVGFGGWALVSALKAGRHLMAAHINTTVRQGVDQYCGTNLTDTQWIELMKTPEWFAFRKSLPIASIPKTLRVLLEPSLRFYAGSLISSFSAGLLLSAALDEEMADGPGPLSAALLFGLGIAGKAGALDILRRGLFLFDPNAAPFQADPMCQTARHIVEKTPAPSADAGAQPAPPEETEQPAKSSGYHMIGGIVVSGEDGEAPENFSAWANPQTTTAPENSGAVVLPTIVHPTTPLPLALSWPVVCW